MSRDLILVVDDDDDVRAFVRASLEADGYQVIDAPDGEAAMRILGELEPAVIILDMGLGQPDGLEVCRRIRLQSNIPIIMLTGRTDEIDQALCLSAGADDYITKPVTPRIIALRVAAILRRASYQPAQNESGNVTSLTGTKLGWESIEIDATAREVRVNTKLVLLTATEYELLKLLVEHPKQVFARAQLAPILGAGQNFGLEHALDTHASRLRLKIRRAGGPEVVVAVRGVGYRLSAPK